MNVFSKRVIAYFIDFFVVSAFMWVISFICYFLINTFKIVNVYNYAFLVLPLLILIYFTVMEGSIGATIGKRLMFIEVVSTTYPKRGKKPKVSYAQAFVRSLSKIFWIPVILDLILGKISGNVRILDKVSRTKVVNEGENLYIPKNNLRSEFRHY